MECGWYLEGLGGLDLKGCGGSLDEFRRGRMNVPRLVGGGEHLLDGLARGRLQQMLERYEHARLQLFHFFQFPIKNGSRYK